MILLRYLLDPVTVFLSLSSACASGPDLKNRFVEMYSGPFAKLEAFYRNIDLVEETSGPGTVGRYGGPVSFHWRANGTRFRDDLLSRHGVIAQSRIARDGTACQISTTAKTRMSETNGEQRYAVTQVYTTDGRELLRNARIRGPRLAFCAYCLYEDTILSFVQDKSLDVTALDESEPGKLRMLCTVTGDNGNTLDSELVFDKDRSWALVSYGNRRIRTEIEYGESAQGMPIPTRVTHYWNGDFSKPAVVSVLKEFKPGPIPDSVFTLAEFGLPEFVGVKKREFPFFLVMGVSGLLLVFILGWLLRRRDLARSAARTN